MSRSLNNIIEKLDFKSNQQVGDIFGCSRSNIHKRRKDGSLITREEIYLLYDHAVRKGWYNKIGALKTLVDEAFPRLSDPGQLLAEYTSEPWQDLTLFLPALEEARIVADLLRPDVRSSNSKRTVNIYIPASTELLKQIVDLFSNSEQLRIRYELSIYQVDDMAFISAVLVVDKNLLLQPSSKGFLPVGDVASIRYFKEANSITNVRRPPVFGPANVKAVGMRQRLPSASDQNNRVMQFTGQLSGTYQLTAICDKMPNESEQWRLRLSATGRGPIEPCTVEVFDQGGRTIVKVQSDNLPWQGFWPDTDDSPLMHLDELLLTEN